MSSRRRTGRATTGTRNAVAALAAVMLVAAACTTDHGTSTTANATGSGYRATIRRTTDGVPHITSSTVEGVLYGQGWASSEDHACTLADQVLKVEASPCRAMQRGTSGNVNSALTSEAKASRPAARV